MKRYSPKSLTLIRTLFVTAALVFAATPVVAQKVETGFLDRTVVVNKNEYRYQVFVPREFSRTKTWPVIIVLHGGGTYGSDGIRPTEGGLGRVSFFQTLHVWLPSLTPLRGQKIGRQDRAFAALNEAIDKADQFIGVVNDPFMKPLHDDARFQQVMRRIGFPN